MDSVQFSLNSSVSFQKNNAISSELKKEVEFEKTLISREIQAEIQQALNELQTISSKKISTPTSESTIDTSNSETVNTFNTSNTSNVPNTLSISNTTNTSSAGSNTTKIEQNTSIQQEGSTSVSSSVKSEELTKKEPVSVVDNIPKTSLYQYDDFIKNASKTYNVPEALIRAVIKAESSFNPNAVSQSGAQGLMQLMPKTAASLGVKDSFDPEQNINGGVKYLSQLLSRYDGNVKIALAAYNAGPGNVDKYGGVPPFEETQNYVKKILNL